MADKWIALRDEFPPEHVELMTKIDDDEGIRKEQSLWFYNNLWWTGDDGNAMYVYYMPTHWKLLEGHAMTTENQPVTVVQVSLFHITKPEAWRIDYWTSFCRTVRRGQSVVLTNSHESKEALKRLAADELSSLGQVAIFVEGAQP